MGLTKANAAVLLAESNTPGFIVNVGTPVTNTASLQITINNFPAGYQAGDILLAWATRLSGSVVLGGSTAGWNYANTSQTRFHTAWRLATGTDNSPAFGASGTSTSYSGCIVAIRGCSLSQPVIFSGNCDQIGSGSTLTESAGAVNYLSMFMVLGGSSLSGGALSTNSSGFTTDLTFSQASRGPLACFHHVVDVPGQQPSCNINLNGTNTIGGVQYELRPLN